jgi:hypothetical protein
MEITRERAAIAGLSLLGAGLLVIFFTSKPKAID